MATLPILSYSLRVSLLVDIAEKAHVSVEGVIRVLTREPVSDAIKERVLAVLDELDAEQTRVLQRFALAALHDVLPRPYEAPLGPPVDDWDPDVPEAVRGLLPPAPAPAPEPQQLPPAPQDTAHLVQLSAVLEELAAAVRDLRQETDTERRERVDDLAVLIELISTGWQGLDRRLGRLERQLGRLEPAKQQAPVPAPAPVQPRTPPSERPPEASPPPPPPPAEPVQRGERDRLPLAAALALVGVVIGTVAVLQLVSGDADTAGIVSSSGNGALVEGTESQDRPAPTARPATTSASPATTRATTTQATTTQATTTAARRTTTRPAAARPARPPAATTTTTGVLGTVAEQPRPATTAAASGFEPTRNWAWAPVADADYYAVEFLRDGSSLYRTTTEVPRLTLPDSVEFRPGSYRWTVRPGFREAGGGRLGAPVVDSGFVVQR